MPLTVKKGDVWKIAHPLFDWIVIPINIGWTKAGLNVMGRGLARQAAERCPTIQALVGDICMKERERLTIASMRCLGPEGGWNLIFAPTKPLRDGAPHLSWQGASTLERVQQSLNALQHFVPPGSAKINKRVYVPHLGCGNGKLDKADVEPLMERYLTAPHFMIVKRR